MRSPAGLASALISTQVAHDDLPYAPHARFSMKIMYDDDLNSFLVALVDEPNNPRVDVSGRTIEGYITTTAPLGPGGLVEDDPHEVRLQWVLCVA